jgi:hypothetical protein
MRCLPSLKVVREHERDAVATNEQGGGGLWAGVGAGALAALVGAGIWTAFVELTGWKVGLVAVGIGFLVGYAISLAGGSHRYLPAFGALLSLAGCLAGDLLIDAREVAKAFDADTMTVAGRMATSPDLLWAVFRAGFGILDLVFWAIAAHQGWRIVAAARAERVRPAPAVGATFPTAATVYQPAPAYPPAPGYAPGYQPPAGYQPPTAHFPPSTRGFPTAAPAAREWGVNAPDPVRPPARQWGVNPPLDPPR